MLNSGDITIMSGMMQQHYSHRLVSGDQHCEPRVSLTFRWVCNHASACPLAPRKDRDEHLPASSLTVGSTCFSCKVVSRDIVWHSGKCWCRSCIIDPAHHRRRLDQVRHELHGDGQAARGKTLNTNNSITTIQHTTQQIKPSQPKHQSG